jgi:antirestriction protein ArdC
MKRDDLHTEVTQRILAELEAGAAPWVQPWSTTPGSNQPANAATGRLLSGANVVLLWIVMRTTGYATPRFYAGRIPDTSVGE